MNGGIVGPSREFEEWVDAVAARAAMPSVIAMAVVVVVIVWRFSRSAPTQV